MGANVCWIGDSNPQQGVGSFVLGTGLAQLSSQRFTVVFPDNTTGIYVDPHPRFVEQDDWNAGRTWTKDYQWRGFTVFVLKAALENSDRDQQPFHPIICLESSSRM